MLVGKGFQYFKLFYIVFLYFMIVVFMYLKKNYMIFCKKFLYIRSIKMKYYIQEEKVNNCFVYIYIDYFFKFLLI